MLDDVRKSLFIFIITKFSLKFLKLEYKYSVVLVSGIQQWGSVIIIYVSPPYYY